MRLTCPAMNDSKELRKCQWKKQIEQYIHSPEMEFLLGLFGYEHKKGDLESQLRNLLEFTSLNWDFRKASGSGERWTIEDRSEFVMEHAAKIIEAVNGLGMIHERDITGEFDYIIPLGGARKATYERIEEAYNIFKEQKKKCNVVTLAAMRPLAEIEIPFVEPYLEGAEAGINTEYDVACAAVEVLFHVKDGTVVGENREGGHNLEWKWKTYAGTGLGVLSAPSTCPEKRRANSSDTFVFFLEKYNVPVGSKILFTTSSIYINYQLPSFMNLAIEYGLEISFSGSGEPGRINPVISNYLQELKGSIDAICNSLNIFI